MYIRKQLFEGLGRESAFLWGARQTGKSTLLKSMFPDSDYFDLLKDNEYERFRSNPSELGEILDAKKVKEPVIIDEIQRIPRLLHEVHWLIVNKKIQFILCGSSPRKIVQSGGNLLGGRALRYELYPLVYLEIPDFDLIKAINHGLLPHHYMAVNCSKLHSAYIGNYLRDEIIAEARIRNIPSFSRFLDAAAFSNGEMINYANIASECSVSAPTVKEYFNILEDTLTGRFLLSFQKRPKRRVIHAPKFYYFDVGIANYLLKRKQIVAGSEMFGKAFEHFIYQEICAHCNYSGLDYPVHYWRTASQLEVDFILGDHEIAVEVKSSERINPRYFRGLSAFAEEYKVKQSILVCNEIHPRKVGDILILPWREFLERLWAGALIS